MTKLLRPEPVIVKRKPMVRVVRRKVVKLGRAKKARRAEED